MTRELIVNLDTFDVMVNDDKGLLHYVGKISSQEYEADLIDNSSTEKTSLVTGQTEDCILRLKLYHDWRVYCD